MNYSVKYTIGCLTGFYADKYSVLLEDAQYLDRFLKNQPGFRSIAELAAGENEPVDFDGSKTFMKIMKLLKIVTKDRANDVFFMNILCEGDGGTITGDTFQDENEQGPFALQIGAYDITLTQNGTQQVIHDPAFTITGKKGTYRCQTDTVVHLFKEKLMNLANLCEEAMAKESVILARRAKEGEKGGIVLFHLPD